MFTLPIGVNLYQFYLSAAISLLSFVKTKGVKRVCGVSTGVKGGFGNWWVLHDYLLLLVLKLFIFQFIK